MSMLPMHFSRRSLPGRGSIAETEASVGLLCKSERRILIQETSLRLSRMAKSVRGAGTCGQLVGDCVDWVLGVGIRADQHSAVENQIVASDEGGAAGTEPHHRFGDFHWFS